MYVYNVLAYYPTKKKNAMIYIEIRKWICFGLFTRVSSI